MIFQDECPNGEIIAMRRLSLLRINPYPDILNLHIFL